MLLVNDPGKPHEHLAALMLVSRTLQRLLREKDGHTEEQMSEIRMAALEIADTTRINIDFKKDPEGG